MRPVMAMFSSWGLAAGLCLHGPRRQATAQPIKSPSIGLVHSQHGGQLPPCYAGKQVKLVGSRSDSRTGAESQGRGARDLHLLRQIQEMLDETHRYRLGLVEITAPGDFSKSARRDNSDAGVFEKPLASTLRMRWHWWMASKYHRQGDVEPTDAWWGPTRWPNSRWIKAPIGKPWRFTHCGPRRPGSTRAGKYFFAWVTDPVRNGAGALVDFRYTTPVVALVYGEPRSAFTPRLHLRPEDFPRGRKRFRDAGAAHKNGINIFEGQLGSCAQFPGRRVVGSPPRPMASSPRQHLHEHRRKGTRIRPGDQGPAAHSAAARAGPTRSRSWSDALKTPKPIEAAPRLSSNVGVVEIRAAGKSISRGGRLSCRGGNN